MILISLSSPRHPSLFSLAFVSSSLLSFAHFPTLYTPFFYYHYYYYFYSHVFSFVPWKINVNWYLDRRLLRRGIKKPEFSRKQTITKFYFGRKWRHKTELCYDELNEMKMKPSLMLSWFRTNKQISVSLVCLSVSHFQFWVFLFCSENFSFSNVFHFYCLASGIWRFTKRKKKNHHEFNRINGNALSFFFFLPKF